MKTLTTMTKTSSNSRFLSTGNGDVWRGFSQKNCGSDDVWGNGGVLGGKIILNDFDLISYEEPESSSQDPFSTPEPFSPYELFDVTHFEMPKNIWQADDLTFVEKSFTHPEPFAKDRVENVANFSSIRNCRPIGNTLLDHFHKSESPSFDSLNERFYDSDNIP